MSFRNRSSFYICVLVAAFGLCSCAEMARDMDLDGATDVELRSGARGTQAVPMVLDPFKQYSFVMAANECRFYSMKVPANWYWKVYITAASRKENSEGRLNANIYQSDPQWAALPATAFEKSMTLHQDGDQAVLAVGNTAQTRSALLRLCQEGVPVNVTIESQVSTTANLLGPDSSDLKHDR